MPAMPATTFQPVPEQPISVPRRALDFEDYIDIARRHRAWILGPAFLGLVLGVVTAFLWEDSYVARGKIRITPPQVPARLVPGNVSEELTARINAIAQEIITRSSLQNLIQTYNLYPEDRKRLPMEDVIDRMRRSIGIDNIESYSRAGSSRYHVFTVSFVYSDRRLAQRVVADLIDRFTKQSIESRLNSSRQTTLFLSDQYEAAKRELDDLDARIAVFRSKYFGELPEQEQMIVSRLSSMEASLQATASQLSRAQQDKIQLETQIRDLRDQAAALAQQQQAPSETAGLAAPRNPRIVELQREIERARNSLRLLRESYTDSHPDVRRLVAFIEGREAQLKELIEEERKQLAEVQPDQPGPRVISREAMQKLRDLSSAITRLQAALQAKDMEIEEHNRRINDLKERIRSTQSRLESGASISQEYLQLVRERELAARRYEDIGRKLQDSNMATDLVSRGQSETMEVLESPVIPEEPIAPNRPLIISVGVALGLAVGIALATVREFKDTSLKNLKDVRAYTRLTVLGSIPVLENDFVVRRRRRITWLAWTFAILVGILLMAGAVFYYYTQRS
ncbi:MAG: chain-length determining protein [Bryobacteraceae bacterium]|nr:MAG: chain-length determining protein [Bryobacteraceae bacterium]